MLQIIHPSTLAWDFEHLVQANGRSSVLLYSSQGLELKGSFIRTTMVVPTAPADPSCPFAGGETSEGGSAYSSSRQREKQVGQEQVVALFLGAPRLGSLSELRVSDRVSWFQGTGGSKRWLSFWARHGCRACWSSLYTLLYAKTCP